MATKTSYRCKECGHKTVKWLGKCPQCNAWNSFEKVVEASTPTASTKPLITPVNIASGGALVESIDEVLARMEQHPTKRLYPFSANNLNQFWGGGLTAGGLTLLAGEPGLGKSTLSLQLLRALWNGTGAEKSKRPKLLYITAEESVFELARRSQRLNIPKEILVLQANNFEQITTLLDQVQPDIVIIDSIQTISSSHIPASPGSISQVSTLASQFLAISKAQNVSIIIIGHVTKDGQIAGPKTLEHLVDSVLLLEPSESSKYRTLSFSKHRFGNTTGMLLLKMEESGLEIVTDPSLALLENIETGVGVVYAIAMDKDLPLVVEVQALVSQSNTNPMMYGKREVIGLASSKLNTILAIAEKYLDLQLRSLDVYIQISGLPKSLKDDSLDLAILLAILSSIKNQPIGSITKQAEKQKLIFAGRLTLSGKLRNATEEETRKLTARQLGFIYNPSIKPGELRNFL